MRKSFLFIILIITAAFVIYCGKPKKDLQTKTSLADLPASVLVEKVIPEASPNSTFKEPFGLATDFSGNIYISDAGNDRIVKLNNKFDYITEIGGFGSGEGTFNYPTYLSFDNGLNLYVSDERNSRIAKYDNRLNYADEVLFYDDEDPLKFGYPSGVAATNYGELWVADRQNNQVMVFNNVGQFSNVLGDYGSSAGRLKSPEKIVQSGTGFILCDAGNQRIVYFDGYGNFNHEVKCKAVDYPIAVIDKRDYLIVLDGLEGGIHFVDQKGNSLRTVGPQLPGEKKSMLEPSDFISLDDDRILIADTGNNRLLVCRLLFNKGE